MTDPRCRDMIPSLGHDHGKRIDEAFRAGEVVFVTDAAEELLEHDAWNGERHVMGDQSGESVHGPSFELGSPSAAKCGRKDGRIQEDHRFLRARL